jgi:2'-5' RNA ligase
MLRLFFALQPNLEQNTLLAERAAPLVSQLVAQPVPAENLHATLCFMGAIPTEKLERLRAVAAAVRGRRAALLFEAFEHWERPKIVCATARESEAAMPARELALVLGSAAVEAGFAPDIKPFRAHLTLARKVRVASAKTIEWPRPISPPLLVLCERFVLMQSQRGEQGSIYSVVDSWPLYGDDPG